MKKGDLVCHHAHKGTGIILSIRPFDGKMARVFWTAGGRSTIEELLTRYLKVINESR